MSITDNLNLINKTIPSNLCLVAVSKTKPIVDIIEAYNAGHRSFGENKAQEMTDKYNALPKDIQWHFIGHLQTNKVKIIAPFVHLIHSVDSYRLLLEINKEGLKNNRCIDCLLQMYIAEEDSKFGMDYLEAEDLLKNKIFDLNGIRIVGVMGIATFTSNHDQIRKEFSTLNAYFNKIKAMYFNIVDYFKEISMGMTDDYKIAIEQGSTIVRIGSAIFGNRKYNL